MASTLSLSEKTIEKHLKKLREQGIIRRVGPDKGDIGRLLNLRISGPKKRFGSVDSEIL